MDLIHRECDSVLDDSSRGCMHLLHSLKITKREISEFPSFVLRRDEAGQILANILLVKEAHLRNDHI